MTRIRPIAAAIFGAGLWLSAMAAHASDPWPDEAIQPPPNTNIVLYYNAFTMAGSYGTTKGVVENHNTRVNVDLQALRYIHTFNVQGVLAGVQLYVPYVSFIGNQRLGIDNIPAPQGMPPGAPAYGPGRETLSAASGFGQPSFGAFVFPFFNQSTSTGLVLGAWISPPVSSYDKNAALNYSQNLWTGELEAGFRTTLLGQPGGRNLALSVWGETYFYGSNGDAGLVSPAISANDIPSDYGFYHQLNPAVPANNPLRPQSVKPATFSMQPTEELRVYLPYQFYPKSRAFISPGFYQSFGGKGIYTLPDGTKLDSGTRTDETQLRLIVSTFLTPHWQLALNGEYDVMAHGGPLYRTIELRIGAAF
ncbi:transporter [Acidocella aminolytica]|uniref:Phenol degradation meta-pathway protein n=1 Tax=Acidocella aminolytica 101 = DSM 11237 TaxID=1120923 RepID=A0A0D6PKI3_9PROT|nr:transporter [Acidocella aminolytica]GAN82167.1 phenol degradation meta-pathway protein [Acidocella aminolytica 101 = DSM 11237]SHF55750.1 Putative MetA-pathway of phenol degradation [Acidocella aminolytica 101 = DSM 11237]